MRMIQRRTLFCLLIGLPLYAFFGCSDDDSSNSVNINASQVLQLANEAIHNSGSLEGLNTLSYDNVSQRFVAGESMVVGEAVLSADIITSVSIDNQNDYLKADYQKAFHILPGGVDFSEIIRGNLGYIDGRDGFADPSEPDMLSDRVGSTKRFFLYTNPQFLLKKAGESTNNLTLGEEVIIGGNSHYTLNYTDEYGTFSINVEQTTGQINRIETVDYDYLFGDVALVVDYANYTAVNGYSLPQEISITFDEMEVYEEIRTNIQVNPTLDAMMFDFPADANPIFSAADFARGSKMSNFHQAWLGVGAPRDGREVSLLQIPIDDDVFFLRYKRYNSLIVVQDDNIVVVDPNLFPELSQAIIDWLGANYPNRPVSHIVSTHHHTDHLDGIRAYVAQNTEVVAASLAEPFLTKALDATHTIISDYQISSYIINTVNQNGSLTLGDTNIPIDIYQTTSSHSEDQLILHLPTKNLIYSTDFYSVGLFPQTMPLPPSIKGRGQEFNSILLNLGLTAGNSLASGHGPGVITYEAFVEHINL